MPPLQAEDMAVCGWERVVFTDGSKTEQGVGAGYVIPADASLDPAHMAILGPQTVNRAELTAQHAVLEDLVGGGSVALYTDSKFSIQKLMDSRPGVDSRPGLPEGRPPCRHSPGHGAATGRLGRSASDTQN